jgi:HAE1 family hydrophobic/amphiphilic exporter-1
MVAVFVPVAFMTGPVGVFYRQFSVTMATSIVLSGVVALTLTPVLCAMMLRPHQAGPPRGLLGRALALFDRAFEWVTGAYVALLQRIVPWRTITLGAVLLFGSRHLRGEPDPAGRVHPQRGPGDDLRDRPDAAGRHARAHQRGRRGACRPSRRRSRTSSRSRRSPGYEILTEGRGSNAGTCLIALKDWSEREHGVEEVIEELEEKSKDLGAVVEFFEPPAVPGYGAAGGFALRLLDKTNTTDYQEFDQINKEFMEALGEAPRADRAVHVLRGQLPAVRAPDRQRTRHAEGRVDRSRDGQPRHPDREHLRAGLHPVRRFFKVYTQAAPEFRRLPSDILQLYVKNDRDEMVPYSAFMTMKKTQGPNEITRYNLYNSPRSAAARRPATPPGTPSPPCRRSPRRPAPRLRHRLGGPVVRRGPARQRGDRPSSWSCWCSSTSCSRRSTRASCCPRGGVVAAPRVLRLVRPPERDGPRQRHLRPGRPGDARRACSARTRCSSSSSPCSGGRQGASVFDAAIEGARPASGRSS